VSEFENQHVARLLAGEYENMQSCIRCGLCLSVCPTYQISMAEEEGPRGRIAMARALTEGHLALTPDFIAHQQSCLLCEACTAICPAGVRMEPLGIAVRATIQAAEPPGGAKGLTESIAFRGLFARASTFRSASALARLYQRSGIRWLARKTGILRALRLAETEALLPDMDRHFFVPRNQRIPAIGSRKGEVALFAGCIMSTAFAETDRATARVLTRNGYDVTAPAKQGCCGALHLHGGDIEGARELARRNIDAFAAQGDATVVVNAAGCGSTLKGYGHLLGGDPDFADRAASFSAGVRDVTEFLASLPLDPPRSVVDLTVTLQEPCHLASAQRIRSAPREVLRAIPGIRLVEMNESAFCCGSAGIYNLTQPERSQTLLQRKLDNALATPASVIATANPGCQLQIQAGLRERKAQVQVRHIVDLLDDAYRAEEQSDRS
jgi:glycolate oxidase iron-sulfur subunit